MRCPDWAKGARVPGLSQELKGAKRKGLLSALSKHGWTAKAFADQPSKAMDSGRAPKHWR